MRDLLMRRRGAAGRNFDDHMKKFRHFIRCHHPVLSILRHGLNRKSTVIVYQFHGERYHFEWEIAFVANGDRSTYSFALFAAPITPMPSGTVGQRHFDIGLKRRGQLFSERYRHAFSKPCIPPRYAHQSERKNHDNDCCYRLNSCGVFIKPLHFRCNKDTKEPLVDNLIKN